MIANNSVAQMTSEKKLEEAIRRSLPYLPAEAKSIVESMLTPQSLAIITATLLIWVGSHLFGVGEVVDVILLGVGIVTVGFAAFEGAGAFCDFVKCAINAETPEGLDTAARHFAQAVTILGISTVQGLLLRGQVRAAASRGTPKITPRSYPGSPPPASGKLNLSRPWSIPGRFSGETTPYGIIKIARNQKISEQRLALFHELVHRYFSPKVGPLRQLRAELNLSAYSRSAFLRYLEEALAEGYAQLQVNGLTKALGAYKFPLKHGYATVSQLQTEGAAIGTIILGAEIFHVSIVQGNINS